MKTSNHLRILVDQNAQTSLDTMLEELKRSGEFIKINPSLLASWIISTFKTEFFESQKSQIIQEHFNSKEYLRDLSIKIQSSDNAADVLSAALEKIQMKVKKPNPKKEKISKN